MTGGFQLFRVFLQLVVQLFKLHVAEQGIVVEAHFRIKCNDIARSGDDEGIDFHDRAVEGGERAIHCLHEPGERGYLLAGKPEAERKTAGLEREEPGGGIDRGAQDFLW